MKQATIFCRELNRGTLYFYVSMDGEEHYLFGQSFRYAIWKRYRYGVLLDDALDYAKCHGNPTLAKIAEKLPKAITAVEKEYGITVLRGKKKKSRQTHQRGRDAA